MRDLAEKKYGRVANGDVKPNAWTLLDYGQFLSFALLCCRHHHVHLGVWIKKD